MPTLPIAETQSIDRERRRLMSDVSSGVGRLRLQAGINAAITVLLITFCLFPILVIIDKLFSLTATGFWNIWVVWSALIALGIPYVLVCSSSSTITSRLAAAKIDETLGLKDRLSTALAVEKSYNSEEITSITTPEAHSFSNAFYAETADRIPALNVGKAMPIQFPRGSKWLPVPLMIAGALWVWMPEQDMLGRQEVENQKKRIKAIQEKSSKTLNKKLMDLKKELSERNEKKGSDKTLKGLIKKAEKLARQIKDGKQDPQDTLSKLNDLKKKIEESRQQIRKDKGFMDKLSKLAKGKGDHKDPTEKFKNDLSEAMRQKDPMEMARQLRKLARQLKQSTEMENGQPKDQMQMNALDKINKMREELERLATEAQNDPELQKRLEKLSHQLSDKLDDKFDNKNGPQLSEEQMKKLAELLDKLGKDFEDLALEDEDLLDDEEYEELENLEDLEISLEETLEDMMECEGCKGGGKKIKLGIGKGKGKKKGKRIRLRLPGKGMGKPKPGSGGKGNQPGNNNQKGKPGDGLSGGQGYGTRPLGDEKDSKFASTKVKGRMQSGAIESLSYFRGRGKKGKPPKEFIETLVQSQQEDESAVELDRIPADSKELIKNYFSDLKSAGKAQDK